MESPSRARHGPTSTETTDLERLLLAVPEAPLPRHVRAAEPLGFDRALWGASRRSARSRWRWTRPPGGPRRSTSPWSRSSFSLGTTIDAGTHEIQRNIVATRGLGWSDDLLRATTLEPDPTVQRAALDSMLEQLSEQR